MKALAIFKEDHIVMRRLIDYFEKRSKYHNVSINYSSGTFHAEETSFLFRKKVFLLKVIAASESITNVSVRIKSSSALKDDEVEEELLCNKFSSYL